MVGGLGACLSIATLLLVREPEKGRQMRISLAKKIKEAKEAEVEEGIKGYTTMNAEKVD